MSATTVARGEELDKKDRILNALVAATEDTTNQEIADATDATGGYVSQIRKKINQNEITQEDIDAVRDSEIVSEYESLFQGEEQQAGMSAQEQAREEISERQQGAESATTQSASEAESTPETEVSGVSNVINEVEEMRREARFEAENTGDNSVVHQCAVEKEYVLTEVIDMLQKL